MPVDDIKFVEGCFTVEGLYESLKEEVDAIPEDTPGLYIIDSMDALSDEAEMKRDIGEGSYGANKAKKLSEMFRKLVKVMGKKKMTFMVVSQIRDKMNVSFGKKTTRSGGRALDFYASQIMFLAHVKTLKATRKGIERSVGVNVKVKCEKNKVGLPFRECQFPIMFGYGVDDLRANLEMLKDYGGKVKMLGEVEKIPTLAQVTKLYAKLQKLPDDEFMAESDKIADQVRKAWASIETEFLPTRKKY